MRLINTNLESMHGTCERELRLGAQGHRERGREKRKRDRGDREKREREREGRERRESREILLFPLFPLLREHRGQHTELPVAQVPGSDQAMGRSFASLQGGRGARGRPLGAVRTSAYNAVHEAVHYY